MAKVGDRVIPPPTFSLKQHQFIPEPLPDAEIRLQTLTQAIQDDLEVLAYPSRTWNYCRDPGVKEVAIVGAGHTGKSIAFGLRRHGIENVQIFDRNPPHQAGPWRSYARNHTLRTPKEVTGGLDWGIPNLNVQRWCIARYGKTYWQQMTYIPRLLWAEYLDWYSDVLALPVQTNTDIETITWNEAAQWFELHSSQMVYQARFVVLATGITGAGGKFMPEIVTASLPPDRYAHTSDAIDFAQLAGQRVAIVGGGASAFDNANAALAAGADRVDLMIRRATLPNVNRIRWSEWNGYHRHFIDLDDEAKWNYTLAEVHLGQLPPAHTYYEAMSHPRFHLYTKASIEQLSFDREIIGIYGDKQMRHDFLICGTGFNNSLVYQPELRHLAPHMQLWRDVYQPKPGYENLEMANYPYLGKNFEFLPRDAGHDYLQRVYYLSSGIGWLSGFRAYLSGLQFAAPRVCYAIGRHLFLEHQTEIREAFDRYATPEY
jgi:FAD-dependent urate hydroxylase